MIVATLVLGFHLQRGPRDLPLDAPLYGGMIGRMVREAGLSDLRTLRLAGTDAEIRIWSGFSLGRTSGFALRRRGGIWRGYRIAWSIGPGTRSRTRLVPLAPPKRGWDAFWRELESRGLRTIPDQGSLPDDGVRVDDGVKYLFEIRIEGRYRAYYYDNPEDHPKQPSAMQVAKIARVIERDLPGVWR